MDRLPHCSHTILNPGRRCGVGNRSAAIGLLMR
jgi:hypothetical protein